MERLARQVKRLRLCWMLVEGAIVSKTLLDLCIPREVLRGVGWQFAWYWPFCLLTQRAVLLLLRAIPRCVAISKLMCRETVGHC